MQPKFGTDLIDGLQKHVPAARITVILILFLFVGVVLAAGEQILVGRLGEETVRQTRLSLSKHLFSLPVLMQEQKDPAWYSQRTVNDATLVKLIASQTITLIGALVLLIGSGAASLIVDGWAFLVGVGFALISIMVTILASRAIQKLRKAYKMHQ